MFVSLGALTACQNPIKKAVRETTYSAYELIGVQKRDLLKSRVKENREDQKEAGESFEDALQKLKSVYGFNGGDLEKQYDRLKSSYDQSNARAQEVHKSIKKVEDVAGDLFAEWAKEIEQIDTTSLKEKSRQNLAATKEQYRELHTSLKASEARMDPVLKKFKDQVLYLKHNLNAKAIGSLKGESANIQSEIAGLIKEMNKSVASADEFIQKMP